MQRSLTPPERLIVAADFKPKESHEGSTWWVRHQVLQLAQRLKGSGVYLKVNSALRSCGEELINQIHDCGLKVFTDFKLIDIGETLAIDGAYLKKCNPELLTAMCCTGVTALQALKAELPNTEVLRVTVLTHLKDDDTQYMHSCTVEEGVMRFAQIAAEAKIDGLISAPKEVAALRARFGSALSLNTPGIRPTWSIVKGDDQNPDRIMTPVKAIQAGADRIAVGRPITQAQDPYAALMRTIDEVASAT